MQIRIATLNDVESIVDFQLKMAAATEEIELHKTTVLKGFTAVIME
jgi:hypothetical protein